MFATAQDALNANASLTNPNVQMFGQMTGGGGGIAGQYPTAQAALNAAQAYSAQQQPAPAPQQAAPQIPPQYQNQAVLTGGGTAAPISAGAPANNQSVMLGNGMSAPVSMLSQPQYQQQVVMTGSGMVPVAQYLQMMGMGAPASGGASPAQPTASAPAAAPAAPAASAAAAAPSPSFMPMSSGQPTPNFTGFNPLTNGANFNFFPQGQ